MGQGANVGLRGAIEPLEGAEVGAPTPEIQDGLFDLDGPDGATGPLTRLFNERAERRGPGRPKGSPNKRTEDLRRFILARFKHPVVALMEIGSIPTIELISELRLDPDKALALQIRALSEAAPYVDSKMPMKLTVSDGDRLPEFHLHFGSDGSAKATDQQGRTMDLEALYARAKRAMDQRLIGGEAARSHGDGSQENGQVIEGEYKTQD